MESHYLIASPVVIQRNVSMRFSRIYNDCNENEGKQQQKLTGNQKNITHVASLIMFGYKVESKCRTSFSFLHNLFLFP